MTFCSSTNTNNSTDQNEDKTHMKYGRCQPGKMETARPDSRHAIKMLADYPKLARLQFGFELRCSTITLCSHNLVLSGKPYIRIPGYNERDYKAPISRLDLGILTSCKTQKQRSQDSNKPPGGKNIGKAESVENKTDRWIAR